MPDITMCQPKECAVKDTCYRYVATPSNWQSYADHSVNISDGGKCISWIKITVVKDKIGA